MTVSTRRKLYIVVRVRKMHGSRTSNPAEHARIPHCLWYSALPYNPFLCAEMERAGNKTANHKPVALAPHFGYHHRICQPTLLPQQAVLFLHGGSAPAHDIHVHPRILRFPY